MHNVNRQQIEKAFHDRKALKDTKADFYAWGILRAADGYAYELLGDLRNKLVLDLGCGGGHHAVRFAEQGALVYAIDLSTGMVEKTRQKVKEKGLDDRVKVFQMSAEELIFPNETFDLVFGHSILHHTELDLTRVQVHRVLKRVHRVLKRGGKGVFLEPLGHNPLLKLWRRFTPHRRTPTEKPLSIHDVAFFAEPFSAYRSREFYLLALATVALLPFGVQGAFERVLNWLTSLDEHLFTRYPRLRRYAWVTVFEVIK